MIEEFNKSKKIVVIELTGGNTQKINDSQRMVKKLQEELDKVGTNVIYIHVYIHTYVCIYIYIDMVKKLQEKLDKVCTCICVCT
jgi:NTP pyrophosphatase (non-canonical NTP hydrolase)